MRVDAHEKKLVDKNVNQTEQSSWFEAQKSRAASTMHKRLLEQMARLCRKVHGNRMEGKIEHESLERHQENYKLKRKCVREWMRGSIMKKVPGNLCRMIQRQIKHSGSIVCSEDSTAVGKGASGTFARQPLCIAARCSEIFVTRKMEFKGSVTDCTGVTGQFAVSK